MRHINAVRHYRYVLCVYVRPTVLWYRRPLIVSWDHEVHTDPQAQVSWYRSWTTRWQYHGHVVPCWPVSWTRRYWLASWYFCWARSCKTVGFCWILVRMSNHSTSGYQMSYNNVFTVCLKSLTFWKNMISKDFFIALQLRNVYSEITIFIFARRNLRAGTPLKNHKK